MMMRKLLMTTAISLIATTGAIAASNTTAESQDKAAVEAMSAQYMQTLDHGSLASDLMGRTVYTSTAEDAEAVGDINDLVIGEDGSVDAVVIGVGGFLGVGEKNVAVNYDQLHFSKDKNGDEWVVFEASKESLTSAPAFDADAERDTAMAPTDENMKDMNAAPADDQTAMAPADETRKNQPMDQTAMAPADQTGVDKTRDTMATAPANQGPVLADVDAGSLSADEIIGTTVYAENDESVGEVGDVRLSADDGGVDAIIVDVGGFLGLGEKPVAIGFDAVTFKKDENGSFYIYTKFTRDQLDQAPDYDAAAYDEQRDTMRLSMR